MSDDSPSATASAPATVGNVAVGFDILGFAVDAIDDRITVRRLDEPIVRIADITGTATDLPTEAARNTATAGLLQLIEDAELECGFEVEIDKGIPLGSGMGGSAASAVGAIVAAASLLETDLSRATMMHYALIGESVASGDRHGDNVAPCLYGGLTLARDLDPPDVVELPVPEGLTCVLVHPHLEIETSRARAVVPGAFDLSTYVEQSTRLAGLIAGCYRDDVEMVGESLEDVLIEPHRSSLVPGFEQVQRAALEAGALGCSLSGAGPSLFALCHPEARAEQIETSMVEAFEASDVEVDSWISPINPEGAMVLEESGRQS